jgi:hypothetical protein
MFTLSGCKQNIEPIDLFKTSSEELLIDEYELPEEVLLLFEYYNIYDITIIEDLIYVSYYDTVSNFITALNHNFEYEYTIFDSDYVYEIQAGPGDTIRVKTYNDNYLWTVYSNKGEELFSMDSKVVINTIDSFNRETFFLDNQAAYYYIDYTEGDSFDTYSFNKITENDTEVLYEFTTDGRVPEVYKLIDDTFLIVLTSNDKNQLIHIDKQGNTLSTIDDVPYNGIRIVDDGYLIQNRETVTKMNLESEIVWTYTGSSYLNFREISENSVTYLSSLTESTYQYIEIFNDGTFNVWEVPRDTREYVRRIPLIDGKETYLNCMDNADLIVWYYEDFDYQQNKHYISIEDADENILWSHLTDTAIKNVFYKNNYIYVQRYGNGGVGWLVDIYDMDGNIVDTDSIQGTIHYITNQGNYIVTSSWTNDENDEHYGERKVIEVNKENRIIWEFEKPVKNIIFTEVDNNLYSISSYDYCYFELWLCDQFYTTYLVNYDGNLVLDLSNQEHSYPLYHNFDSYYIVAPPMNDGEQGALLTYNNLFELEDESEIVYRQRNQYFILKDNKLVVLTFPQTIYNMNYSYVGSGSFSLLITTICE